MYARWNSTPCTIYSFYDNSLFSVGEIILTSIQSAPEIPKLHIFLQQDIMCHSVKSLCKVQENNVHLIALTQGL